LVDEDQFFGITERLKLHANPSVKSLGLAGFGGPCTRFPGAIAMWLVLRAD
jgi:hypothetical protein